MLAPVAHTRHVALVPCAPLSLSSISSWLKPHPFVPLLFPSSSLAPSSPSRLPWTPHLSTPPTHVPCHRRTCTPTHHRSTVTAPHPYPVMQANHDGGCPVLALLARGKGKRCYMGEGETMRCAAVAMGAIFYAHLRDCCDALSMDQEMGRRCCIGEDGRCDGEVQLVAR